MMRDNNCLDKFDKCIEEMREVVAKGGFGTSVTPVSQFYFQQAFRNAVGGKNPDGSWKIDPKGYGKMVLGYFGKTPVEPDPEIVKLAEEQLGLPRTTEAVVAINDRDESLSIKAQVAKLEGAGLETTEENIFIVAACGDKGLNYLKGERPNGIRYKEAAKPKSAAASAYTATVDGRQVVVEVGANGNEFTATVNGKTYKVGLAEGKAAVAAAAPATSSGAGSDLLAPLPGTVTKIVAAAGTQVNAGDTILVIEAMKMETEIKADNAGTVKELCVAQGAVVAAGDKLAVIG